MAAVAVQVAAADRLPGRYDAADQAAARAATLKRADFGRGGWKGGFQKPDFSEATCAGYEPKRSDLLVTGAAAADFEHPDGLSFHSETWIMGTKKMVELDWRRSLDDPDFVPCARKTFGSEPGSTVVSFKRIALPKLAPLSRRYRLVIDQAVEGETVRVMIDLVFIGRGRTEISLLAAAPWAARNAVGNAEIRLSRILLSRARA